MHVLLQTVLPPHEKKDEDVKGWCVFPRKKDPVRRKLWETTWKRGPRWRATKDHAICFKHFINWCQGPSPSHPDPELFAYNQWGKNKYSRKSIYKRESKCSGGISAPNLDPPDSCSQATTSQDVQHCNSPEVEYYASLDQEVQECIEVEVTSKTQDSSVLTGMLFV